MHAQRLSLKKTEAPMALNDATKEALGIATGMLELVSQSEPRLKAIPIEALAQILANLIAPYLTDTVDIEEGDIEIGEGVEVEVT